MSSLKAKDGLRWDKDILRALFNERDRDLIVQIPLGLKEEEDTWSWHMERKGEYTVKSSYKYPHGTRLNHVRGTPRGWDLILKLAFSARIKNFFMESRVRFAPYNASSLREKNNGQ